MIPATAEHVPLSSEGTPPVSLIAIGDIARVNALSKGPIEFGIEGLTVVYGENATGKSSIVRILKGACQTRHTMGAIFPNVFEPDSRVPATATIKFKVGERVSSFNWIDGRPSDVDLRSVHVFDAHSAAVQVSEPNFIEYTPQILQTFRSLADVIEMVAGSLRDEKHLLGGSPKVLSELSLDPDTRAGQYLSSLNAESSQSELETLCLVTEGELDRLEQLKRALTDDPITAVNAEEMRSRKIDHVQELVNEIQAKLSDGACSAFELLVKEKSSTHEAAEAAREKFAASSGLEGVGAPVWRILWEAAKDYSEMHAYVHESFPVVREGAVCVLCQQTISQETSNRLISFAEFVGAAVQRRADEASARLRSAEEAIRLIDIPESSRSAVFDVGISEAESVKALRLFLVRARLRRRSLLRKSRWGNQDTLPPLPITPDLSSHREAVKVEIANLRAAARATERIAMAKERLELESRLQLAPFLSTTKEEIARIKIVNTIDRALADCKSQPITLKARQAAKEVLTYQLRSSFATNCSAMGFHEVPVEVTLGAGEHGKHPYEIKLIPRPVVPPQDILSEGERTCVALAGFLAELEVTENLSAIVLDDPVSSLDHNYRKRVAERLVSESKKRQVIVMTHDVVFLFLLRKYAHEMSAAITQLSVEQGYKGDHGRVSNGPPWIAMSVNDRISVLRNQLAAARTDLTGGNRPAYESKVLVIYNGLRKTWERAVEEVLLNKTVVRFGDAVETKRLPRLVDISDVDVELVNREMSRCSDFHHDEAGPIQAGIPGPNTVEEDITRLYIWIQDLRKNRGRN